MTAAAARGGVHLAGSTSTAYGLAASTSGQTGMGAVAAGIGGVARAGGGAVAQPARDAMSRAAQSLRFSSAAGRSTAWTATGGETPGGFSTSAASSTSESVSGRPPPWAARMKRGSAMSHGASVAAHSVRSSDHGGGSMNVPLDQDDRR